MTRRRIGRSAQQSSGVGATSKTGDGRGYDESCRKLKGNGQKRELPVGSWPETGGQKYEGSKHPIWAHVIGQHHLPPVSGRTPTGTSRFSLLWCLPPGFGHILLHFVALHQSIRFDQPGGGNTYPAQMTWMPVENGRKVMWALATSEFRLL